MEAFLEGGGCIVDMSRREVSLGCQARCGRGKLGVKLGMAMVSLGQAGCGRGELGVKLGMAMLSLRSSWMWQG